MPKKLIDGFQNFIKTHYDSRDDVMRQLVSNGQNPDYFIVSCIDSRAHAGVVFDTPPGTYFAHKSMGAIVRPYKQGTALAAALQFALIHNQVSTVVIMGHTGCGAVAALINDIDDAEISSFVNVAQEALDNSRKNQCSHANLQRCTEENILKLSLKNLKSYPSVAKRLGEGDLNLKAWLFDMHAGALYEYDDDADSFHLLTGKQN